MPFLPNKKREKNSQTEKSKHMRINTKNVVLYISMSSTMLLSMEDSGWENKEKIQSVKRMCLFVRALSRPDNSVDSFEQYH